MHLHFCFTDQKYLKLELMKTSVNGEYQKRRRSLNQMTFTLHKRSTFMWDIVKKVRWQDFYHGQFVVQAKNLLQGDSMAYQMDAADANVVLNPFVTAAAQKGIFFLLSLSNCLRYSSTGARR